MNHLSSDSAQPPATSTNGHSESSSAWAIAGTLVGGWRTIAAVTIAATILAVFVALLLPRDYAAEVRVLRPEGGGISSLLGIDRLPGGIGSALLGGGGSDYTRYLAILNSRSLGETIVDEFDLVNVYDLGDKRHPREAALERLAKNLDFRVAQELRHLSILAYDRDPERAAAMANFTVAELNRRNAYMTSENARQTRVFVETRLSEARIALDSTRAAMQAFQETHGLVELESQAQAFLTGMAEHGGRVAQLEVQYRTLLAQYGDENPRVAAARSAYLAARRQMTGAAGGSELLMPVALREMPAVARQYASLVQEQMIHTQIIETIFPLYEQAKFQERSEMQAVQVLDAAVIPTQPARPSRRLIVAIVMLTTMFAASLFVLAQHWLNVHHGRIAAHLRAASNNGPRAQRAEREQVG